MLHTSSVGTTVVPRTVMPRFTPLYPTTITGPPSGPCISRARSMSSVSFALFSFFRSTLISLLVKRVILPPCSTNVWLGLVAMMA